MTLTQLRAFLAAARHGSFTAAAEDLGIAQASASELVRRLEEEFGVTVFMRGSRRLQVTSAGRELLPWAEKAVAAADGAIRAVTATRTLLGGEATFGLMRNARFYLLSDLLADFHDQHPHVRVRVLGQNSCEVAHAVAGGTLEAGLVVLPVDDTGLQVTPLLRDEVLYATIAPERASRPVTITDLATVPLILYDAHYGWNDPERRQLAERAQLEGLKLAPLIEVESLDEALSLVGRGVGDTVVARAAAESPICPQGVLTTRFADPLYDTLALIQQRGAALSPATDELVRMARDRLYERHRRQPDLLHWLDG